MSSSPFGLLRDRRSFRSVKRSRRRKRTKRAHKLAHLEALEDRRLLSVQDLSSLPAEFVKFDTEVVFSVQDQAGYELWKWDGANASRIVDLNPAGSSYPQELTVVPSPNPLLPDTLYFVASDGDPDFTLWKNDGSTVTEVLDGTGLAPFDPFDLINVGGVLFFVADDGIHGSEVWTTDGTPGGTLMLADIFPPDVDLDGPIELTDVGGTLYFNAYDDTQGWELWTSNGTPAGTQ